LAERKGALERFGVMYVQQPDAESGQWDLQAIEINLRGAPPSIHDTQIVDQWAL